MSVATTGPVPLERTVLVRCCAQDPMAFRAFVVRHERMVFGLLSRMMGRGPEVEDLAQETFVRAYRAFPSFDPDGAAKPSTWLLTIATRLALDALCAQALGATGDVVDKIGVGTCLHLVYDVAASQNATAAHEAHTEAAEIRAGLIAEPPADKQHPISKMFLAATAANKAFEDDLAKSLGPDEAYRLANADGMCTQRSSWGGGAKR